MRTGIPSNFPLGWLTEASSVAAGVDRMAAALLVVSAVLVLMVFGSIGYFLVRYRRGSSAPRRPLGIAEWKIEAAWTTGTTAGFLFFFFWGAALYRKIESMPIGATEIRVTGLQWMWDIRQPTGKREFNTIHVPVGRPVRLRMTSPDVIHSFFVPAFRLKQDVVPGKEVSLWFTATKPGRFALFCSEFCGSKHADMSGMVIAQSPEEYDRWVAGGMGGRP